MGCTQYQSHIPFIISSQIQKVIVSPNQDDNDVWIDDCSLANLGFFHMHDLETSNEILGSNP